MFAEIAELSRMAEDLGYLPLDQVKQMLQRFGKEILPHYV